MEAIFESNQVKNTYAVDENAGITGYTASLACDSLFGSVVATGYSHNATDVP